MELCVNLLKKFNTGNIAVISNFLAFFLFLFEKFPSWIRIRTLNACRNCTETLLIVVLREKTN